MTITKKLNNAKYGLAAGVTTALMSAGSAEAGGLAEVSGTLQTQLGSIPQLFTSASYVMGVGFTIAGLFKLKEYVDDPSGSAMKDALIRLALGALLILLPFVINTSANTVGAETGAEAFDRGAVSGAGWGAAN